MTSATSRRGWSTDDEPTGQYVPVTTRPVFSGVDELRRYEEAVRANPRREGEGAGSYILRVHAAVKAMREPGGDDGE